MNLIEQLDGYENAKAIAEVKDSHYMGCKIEPCPELDIALLQHRREHGLYEQGDYIIFEDELMAFGIWSRKFPDCAYIGYADAEDGMLIDKSDFRHATDAEIKAGRRL